MALVGVAYGLSDSAGQMLTTWLSKDSRAARGLLASINVIYGVGAFVGPLLVEHSLLQYHNLRYAFGLLSAECSATPWNLPKCSDQLAAGEMCDNNVHYPVDPLCGTSLGLDNCIGQGGPNNQWDNYKRVECYAPPPSPPTPPAAPAAVDCTVQNTGMYSDPTCEWYANATHPDGSTNHGPSCATSTHFASQCPRTCSAAHWACPSDCFGSCGYYTGIYGCASTGSTWAINGNSYNSLGECCTVTCSTTEANAKVARKRVALEQTAIQPA